MIDKVYFKKVVNPFKATRFSEGRKYQVFFSVKIVGSSYNEDAHISICGVHGANRFGNAHSCGQIIDNFVNTEKVFNKGWNEELYLEFISLWKKYHLKDATDGTPMFNECIKAFEKFPASENHCAWEEYNN